MTDSSTSALTGAPTQVPQAAAGYFLLRTEEFTASPSTARAALIGCSSAESGTKHRHTASARRRKKAVPGDLRAHTCGGQR